MILPYNISCVFCTVIVYSFQEYRSPQFEKKDIAVSSVALAISASPEGENVTESSMIDIFVDLAPFG